MKSKLDAAGRIVVPTPVKLAKRGKGLVAVPAEKLPALTPEQVRETLERLRR